MNKRAIMRRVLWLTLFFCAFSQVAMAGSGDKKRKRFVRVVAVQDITVDGETYTCGQRKNGKWRAVKSKRRGKYKRVKRKKANRACRTQLQDVAAASSFDKLPSISDLLSGSSIESQLPGNTIQAVAPTLGEIVEQGTFGSIKEYFFPTGVVEAVNGGTPTEEQCGAFFQGISACHMAENTGHTMQVMASAGASSCYMKHMPEAEGGVKLVKGSGNLKNIFVTAPKPKIVKIKFAESSDEDIEPQNEDDPQHDEEFNPNDIYIRIASLSDNQEAGNHYKAELVFCDTRSGNLVGYETIEATKEGQLIVSSAHNEPGFGESNATVTAALKQNDSGTFDFDPAQARVATLLHAGASENDPPESFQFKANITVAPGGALTVKLKDSFGQSASSRFIASDIQEGATLTDLRFLRGAIKDLTSFEDQNVNDQIAATEWNGTFYADTNDSELTDRANVNFQEDPFYDALGDQTFAAPFDCSVTATHVVRLNGSHPGFQSVSEICEANFIDGMDFCSNDSEVSEDAAFQACLP